MKFCDKNFLLSNGVARALYHGTAAKQPIIDYHCHLSPKDLAEDRHFANVHEPWLGGDHYKWRAMRANGVPEKLITGNETSAREKFQAWAKTVPKTLRNPLFHWTHLELQRYFGIEKLLEESTAQEIWDETSRLLKQPGYSVRGLVERMNVKVICTTDDPADNLEHHQAIKKSGWKVKVFPAFRPDNALRVNQPERFKKWVKALSDASGTNAGHVQGISQVAEAAARFLPRQRRPAFRPWPEPDAGAGLHGEKGRRDFLRGAQGQGGFAGGRGPVRVVHDGIFRRARRGQGLGEAASRRRAARSERAHRRQARRGHRLRHHRRFQAGRRAGAISGPARSHRQIAARPSFTT